MGSVTGCSGSGCRGLVRQPREGDTLNDPSKDVAGKDGQQDRHDHGFGRIKTVEHLVLIDYVHAVFIKNKSTECCNGSFGSFSDLELRPNEVRSLFINGHVATASAASVDDGSPPQAD